MKKVKTITHTDSKSLWNNTLSAGWTEEEVNILKLGLQKFGVGKWKMIQISGCLPGKSIGQIYIQTQRCLGQQSLGEFMGLHLDLERISRDNQKKTNVKRKYGSRCIVNDGDNPTKKQRMDKIEENRLKYGIEDEEVEQYLQKVQKIKLPRIRQDCIASYFTVEDIDKDKFNNLEKLMHTHNLLFEIDKKLIEFDDTQKKIKLI